jgi:hypothetical protein
VIKVGKFENLSVADFTHDLNSGAIQYSKKETEFLNVVDEWGTSNRRT